jgi:hypothetical protein
VRARSLRGGERVSRQLDADLEQGAVPVDEGVERIKRGEALRIVDGDNALGPLHVEVEGVDKGRHNVTGCSTEKHGEAFDVVVVASVLTPDPSRAGVGGQSAAPAPAPAPAAGTVTTAATTTCTASALTPWL